MSYAQSIDQAAVSEGSMPPKGRADTADMLEHCRVRRRLELGRGRSSCCYSARAVSFCSLQCSAMAVPCPPHRRASACSRRHDSRFMSQQKSLPVVSSLLGTSDSGSWVGAAGLTPASLIAATPRAVKNKEAIKHQQQWLGEKKF